MHNWYRIAKLLARLKTGQITEQEQQELECWKNSTFENQELYTRWQDDDFLEKGYNRFKNIDSRKACLEMQKRIQVQKQKSIKRQILRWSSIAAILLIAIFNKIYFTENVQKEKRIFEPVITAIESQTPTLTLDNGKTVILDSLNHHFKEAGTLITKEDNSTLTYVSDESESQNKIAFNTIEIPKGAEFHLTLSDGTEVWLNADSKLKYPVAFNKGERIVELDGEAYFKVTPNKTKKFKVITQKQTVEVLGTEFNITDYSEEKNNYTTLVNGKVKVAAGSQSIILIPGTQSIVNQGKIYTRKVNPSEIISWREGMFVLESHTLEETMSKLARWYDFSVLYQNPSLKNVTFKGRIPRYSSFKSILDILEKTGEVKFEIRNKIVIVYR